MLSLESIINIDPSDIVDSMPRYVLPVSVFLTSFLGSLHCAGMCGPLYATVARHSKLYHGGRGFSYALVGAISGFLGESVLRPHHSPLTLSIIAFVMLSLIITSLYRPDFLHRSPIARLAQWLVGRSLKIQTPEAKALALGVATPLLPCGWFYSYAFGSAATENAAWGAIFMLSFWLGTLPALGVIPIIQRTLRPKLSIFSIHLLKGGLVIFAVIVIGIRLYNDLNAHHCH